MTGSPIPADLAASYAFCRGVHRRHGRTYYLATRLLPAWKRPYVHALYAFTRYADDIVDDLSAAGPAERERRLGHWSADFLAGAHRGHPIMAALLDTVDTFAMDRADFVAFLRSMTMDLAVSSYDTYDDLLDYMEGSAAVIGTMMLPILDPSDPVAAREPARQLGLGFQLTNFIRDVAEDLDRGRIYLPLADLRTYGVTGSELRHCAEHRRATPAVRSLVRFEVDRARAHYAAAAPGVAMLTGASHACVRTAYRLYGGILDRVVATGYDPFVRRAVVPRWRRLAVAAHAAVTPPDAALALPAAAG